MNCARSALCLPSRVDPVVLAFIEQFSWSQRRGWKPLADESATRAWERSGPLDEG